MSIESDLKRLMIRLESSLKGFIARDNMKRYADMLAERIRKRTRLGGSVKATGVPRGTLDPLSPGYKKQRKRDKKRGVLSEMTSPSKSNLTRTGQMLDSLRGTSPRVGEIEVGPVGRRRGDDKTNPKVSEYVSVRRPYLNLSDIELKALKDAMAKDILQRLKKTFTT